MAMGWRSAAAAAIGICAAATVSCGEPEDVVYIHVFNAYAAGGNLSIFSNAGTIATGVPFGVHAPGGVEGTAIDRSVWDGAIQVQVDGVPTLATNVLEGFDFYPGESVTLMVTRRTSASDFEVRVMRHTLYTPLFNDEFSGGGVQLAPQDRFEAQPSCALKIYNGMSVGNAYTASTYDLQTEWKISSQEAVELGIFDPNITQGGTELGLVRSQCGGPIEGDARLTSYFERRANRVRGAINRGWYFPVRVNSGEQQDSGLFEWRAGTWDDQSGDTIRGIRSSAEFIGCINAAIQVVPDETGGDPCKDLGGGQSVPASRITYIDEQLERCTRRADDPNYQGIGLPVGGTETTTYYFSAKTFGQDDTCDAQIRIRSRVIEAIFESGEPFEDRNVRSLSEFNFSYDPFSLQHLVAFGRPIDPLYYTFNSRQKSVAAATRLAYPNGVDSREYNRDAQGGRAPAPAPATPAGGG